MYLFKKTKQQQKTTTTHNQKTPVKKCLDIHAASSSSIAFSIFDCASRDTKQIKSKL